MILSLSVAIGKSPVIVLLCFLVVLRSYSGTQRRRTKARWAEDFFVWFSLLGGIANYAWQLWFAARIIKFHDSKEPDIVPLLGLPPKEATMYMKGAFFNDQAHVCTVWAVKAAFLTIQYDMTRAIAGWHRFLIYIASAYLMFTFLFLFFMSFVYCRHDLSTLWSYSNYCSCLNLNSMITTEWAMNFCGDIILIVLYVLIIRRLQIGGRQLLAFGFIFFLLGTTMTVSTVAYAELISINNSPDGTEADDPVFEKWNVWNFSEWAVAMIAVCLPALRSYFREKIFSTRTQRAISEGRPLDSTNIGSISGSRVFSKVENWVLFKWAKASKPSTWSTSRTGHSERFWPIGRRNARDDHELGDWR